SPSFAVRPPTVTRPASIHVSIARREPSPAAASSFCSRSPRGNASADGAGSGFFGLGCGLGGVLFFNGLRRGLVELQGFRDLFERRQLLEGSQAEIVQELAGRRVKRRAPRRLAVADCVNPAATLER